MAGFTPTVELVTILRWACPHCASELEVRGSRLEPVLRSAAARHLRACSGPGW